MAGEGNGFSWRTPQENNFSVDRECFVSYPNRVPAMPDQDERWVVFWCSLLNSVLFGVIPEAERERYFKELAQQERQLPNGQRRRISVRTFRRKWRRLKDEGVPGLYRRRRSDRGQTRSKRADLLARAVELKKEQSYRSGKIINRILKRESGKTIPKSTMYHHLRRAGATRRKLSVPPARNTLRSKIKNIPVADNRQLQRWRHSSDKRLWESVSGKSISLRTTTT